MSGEAAKERVTTAYTWVPSKSKSLATANFQIWKPVVQLSVRVMHHATYAFRDSIIVV